MAPVLASAWWGPEAGLAGSAAGAHAGAAAPGVGLAWWLGAGGGGGGGVVVLSATAALLLLSLLLLLLCASCHGQKKSTSAHPVADHENLMNGGSERDTYSQSADSPATDLNISTSHNGPLTSGTILTDTQDSSPQPSEELVSSQSELRSSKCPQDRQLPSIPPNRALMSSQTTPPASGDGTYEVVKHMAARSRDVSAEDSLYETVKEMKAHQNDASSSSSPAAAGSSSLLPNGTCTSPLSPSPSSCTSPDDETTPTPGHLNGHLDGTTTPCCATGTLERPQERVPLCAGVEYASVDLNKKSRYSADMEARRRSDNPAGAMAAGAAAPHPGGGGRPVGEEPEEDYEEEVPPPVPEKVLDESDNHQPTVGGGGAPKMNGLYCNGELNSPRSPSPGFDNHISSDSESAVYSTVPHCGGGGGDATSEDDKEHDYSSIGELKGLMVPASSSSDLYATVRDLYPQADDGCAPPSPTTALGDGGAPGGGEPADPGYETICIPRTGAATNGVAHHRTGEEAGSNGGVVVVPEPDYENVGEMGLLTSRETSRL